MKKFLVFLFTIFICNAYSATETVNWYKDGQTYAQTTCTVGGNIILPETPTKRGYNFTGWAVALYDFSTLDYTVEPETTEYNLSENIWSAILSYGIINGISLCSVTYGVVSKAGTPDESINEGQYCWCRATRYTQVSSGITNKPRPSLFWVFNNDYSTNSACTSNCARYCVFRFRNNTDFRKAVFGIQ